MPDATTPNKSLFVPAFNADINSWNIPLNANALNIDQALGTYTGLNVTSQSGVVALTVSQSVPLGFIVGGTLTANVTYETPAAAGGFWCVRSNIAANSFNVYFASASGGNSVLIPPGENIIISADGTSNGMAVAQNIAGAAGGSNTQIQVNNNGQLGGYAGFVYTSGTGTLSVPNLTVNGNTVLGFNSGSTTTINGTALSAPNGININGGQFQMNASGDIGIGTAPTAALLTIGGAVSSTSGGYTFPDATVQTTAAPFFAQSIGANGYLKLGTAVLQWGTVSIAGQSAAVVTFPIAFPTACFGVNVTPNSVTSGVQAADCTNTATQTQVTIYNQGGLSANLFWFAIGN